LHSSLIEIYTPTAKRRYGYFVLPFLHDNALVARLDVRFDRNRGVVDIPASWAEPGSWPSNGEADTDAGTNPAIGLRETVKMCAGSGPSESDLPRNWPCVLRVPCLRLVDVDGPLLGLVSCGRSGTSDVTS